MKYNVSETPISSALKRNNIDTRHNNYYKRKNPRKTKIDPVYFPKIIVLYKEGKTMMEIARQFSVCQSTIRRILRKHNVPIITHIRKIKPQKYKEIVDLYKQGLSTCKIAEQYNVSDLTIGYVLKRKKIKLRESKTYHTKITSELRNEALILKNQGFSYSEIARKTGFSRTTITKVLDSVNKV